MYGEPHHLTPDQSQLLKPDPHRARRHFKFLRKSANHVVRGRLSQWPEPLAHGREPAVAHLHQRHQQLGRKGPSLPFVDEPTFLQEPELGRLWLGALDEPMPEEYVA